MELRHFVPRAFRDPEVAPSGIPIIAESDYAVSERYERGTMIVTSNKPFEL
jgi:hypothetical protein